jgi:hypothetical protein
MVGHWSLVIGQWAVGSGQWSDSGLHHFAVHHSAKDLSATNFSAKAELEMLRNFRF